MSIQLTEAQRQAVLNGEDVILLRAELYEAIRESLAEERERRAIAQVALKTAARWAQENPD